MNKFDKLQRNFLRFLDSMSCSYEILELGDGSDNWYLEIEVDTGDNKPFVIKMEDITEDYYEDVQDELDLEDRVEALESKVEQLLNPVPSFPNFNEVCSACSSNNTHRVYRYSPTSPDWTYTPYLSPSGEYYHCQECGYEWVKPYEVIPTISPVTCETTFTDTKPPPFKFTQTEWGTVSCGGACNCGKEKDKPYTDAQLRTIKDHKRY